LPKAIAEVLRHYPETLGPIADVLRLGALRTADEVSDQLYAADRAAVMDALEAFWRSANQAAPIEQKIRALRRLRDLLNAREVSEAAARALAAEMTRPPEEARAVVLDSWRDDITSLYVKRALGTADHRWKLLPAISVLELGTVDSARQELEGVLLKEFALGVDDPEDARAQCHRGAAIRRAAGRPVVVCLNIADDADCGPLAAAAREAAPNCGLLLRTKKALPPDDRCRSMMVHRLEPPLAGNGLLSIIEMIAALNSVCEDLINQ
jgi:hypothetical protein